jgi:hypothetical protein
MTDPDSRNFPLQTLATLSFHHFSDRYHGLDARYRRKPRPAPLS